MLADEWADGPRTAVGMMTSGFPNLLMLAGPQSVSGSTNFPRAIEDGVEWVGDLIEREVWGITRIEAEQAAEKEWAMEVARMQDRLLIRNSKGWFTGYNANLAGRRASPVIRPTSAAHPATAPGWRRSPRRGTGFRPSRSSARRHEEPFGSAATLAR